MTSDSQPGGEASEAGLPGIVPAGADITQAARRPGGHAGQVAPASPPPRRRALDRGTFWPLVATVVPLVATVILLVIVKSLQSPPRHIAVPPPATAGVLSRDYAAEATPQFRNGISLLKSRFRASGAPRGSSFVAAIYSETGHADPLTGAAPEIVFVGVTSGSDMSSTSTQLSRMMAQVTGGGRTGKAEHTAAGPGGGIAECANGFAGPVKASVCAWATSRTAGILIAASRDVSPAQLAVIMRAARPALER
jgi:hypothetical protein